jgi:hypothetical protein
MFCGVPELVTQPRRQSIDRFTRGDPLGLRADEPTLHVEIRLRDNRAEDRRIAVPRQLHVGVQHGLMRELAQPSDLAPRVIGCAWKQAVRRHVDVDRWRINFVRHVLVDTPQAGADTRVFGHA